MTDYLDARERWDDACAACGKVADLYRDRGTREWLCLECSDEDERERAEAMGDREAVAEDVMAAYGDALLQSVAGR